MSEPGEKGDLPYNISARKLRVELRPDGILVGFDYENCVLSPEEARCVIRELGRIIAEHDSKDGVDP